MSHEEIAKTMIVTRRVLRQKEVTVIMTDGKFAKNEISIHLTGLEPSFDPGQAVQEAANAMGLMQERNPILPALAPKTKALVGKALKKGREQDAEAA